MAKSTADAANIAAQRDEWKRRAEGAEERLRLAVVSANNATNLLAQALAELARIRAADRTSITVRTTTAAQMRKGQAI